MQEPDRFDRKLEMILREASLVFADKGYHQAGIREIAASTGVSLSGLYHYFASKEELLFLIQRHAFDTILERLREDLDEAEDASGELRILVRNHLRFFVNNMAEMKVLSHEADSLSGEYAEKILERKRAYTDEAYRILEAFSRDDDPVDPRVAVFSLFGMMNWIYNWYRPERDVPVDQLVEEMLHVFLHGYLAAGVPRAVPDEAADEDSSLWVEP